MAKKVKWGILGLGRIAHKFAHDLGLSDAAELYAVASRDQKKAEAFGSEYGAKKRFSSYEQLSQEPAIDVIYVATPHALHFEHTMMYLEHGKSVVCEKPMGMNKGQVQAMIAKANEKGVFLMEGLWTRFIPATEKLITLLESKVIGNIVSIEADFGFKAELNYEGRILNKSLGGGSLLDVGIYPIYLSLLALGIPQNLKASATFTSSGVDGSCSVLFEYADGAKARLASSIEAETPTEAVIHGTKGEILVHSRFHHSEKLSIKLQGKDEVTIDMPYLGNGYVHEIEEVNKCISQGLLQSEKHPHARSIELSELLDRVGQSIGLNYDGVNYG